MNKKWRLEANNQELRRRNIDTMVKLWQLPPDIEHANHQFGKQ